MGSFQSFKQNLKGSAVPPRRGSRMTGPRRDHPVRNVARDPATQWGAADGTASAKAPPPETELRRANKVFPLFSSSDRSGCGRIPNVHPQRPRVHHDHHREVDSGILGAAAGAPEAPLDARNRRARRQRAACQRRARHDGHSGTRPVASRCSRARSPMVTGLLISPNLRHVAPYVAPYHYSAS